MLWLVYSEFSLSELQTKHPICFFKTLAALVTTEITSVCCCKQNSGLLQNIRDCITCRKASNTNPKYVILLQTFGSVYMLGLLLRISSVHSLNHPKNISPLLSKFHTPKWGALSLFIHIFYEFLWIRLVKIFIFIFIWNFWIGPTSCVGLFIFTFLGAYLMCRKEQEVTYHVKGSTIHVSHACHLWDCSHTHGHF